MTDYLVFWRDSYDYARASPIFYIPSCHKFNTNCSNICQFPPLTLDAPVASSKVEDGPRTRKPAPPKVQGSKVESRHHTLCCAAARLNLLLLSNTGWYWINTWSFYSQAWRPWIVFWRNYKISLIKETPFKFFFCLFICCFCLFCIAEKASTFLRK